MLADVGQRALERSQMIAEREQYTLVDGSTLMEQYKPYNELLALAYRETDSISVSRSPILLTYWPEKLTCSN